MRRHIQLKPGADLDGFRRAVRGLIGAGVAPEEVAWCSSEEGELFGGTDEMPADRAPVSLPRAIAELIESVVCHRDPERYALTYQLAWRAVHGERDILDKQHEPLVHRLADMARSVRRDLHKMHAFLRFRRIAADGEERFIAWFEPEHYIVEAAAPFFVGRFPSMVWSILTPLVSLHWDKRELRITGPARRADAPDGDPLETDWAGYYESTFNPARTNLTAMRREMPQKYWHNLPETRGLSAMLEAASARVAEMIARETERPRRRDPALAVAAMRESAPASLAELNRVIAATPPFVPGSSNAVLGEGPLKPAIALVGEQPGDVEDREGRPFVGPAGQLLIQALAVVGLERAELYVTNAVKHFKFVRRGERRIHQSPTTSEVKHYRWWLMQELDFVEPRLTVALGASAALALTGRPQSVTKARGPMMLGERPGFITVHPSYLLRLPEGDRTVAYRRFLADLAAVRRLAGVATPAA